MNNEAFTWIERSGTNSDDVFYHFWSLLHASGRVVAYVYVPTCEIEDYVAVYDGEMDRPFFDLKAAMKFCEIRGKRQFRGQLVGSRRRPKKKVRQKV